MSIPAVSVTAPVGQAIARVKQVLFRPFDLGRWFIIGFCAWLAGLGQGGGGYNFRLPGSGHHGSADFQQGFDHVRDFVAENLYWIVPLAAVVLVFILALWVVFTWLSSRGQFMFLHCVALNKAEVAVPWSRYAREGNSLFRFRLVLGLVSLAVMLPILIVSGVKAYRMFVDGWNGGGVMALIGLGLLLVLIVITLAIVGKLLIDFVVPIMFLHQKTCVAGWAELRPLLAARVGSFVLYFLFQIVLALAIVLIVILAVLITCCIAGCLMILPYLGTVLLLPLLVFRRAYSLHYLAQFGVEFTAFPPVAPPPLAGPAPAAQY